MQPYALRCPPGAGLFISRQSTAKDICDMLNIQNPSKALKALAQSEKITLTNWYGNPRGGIPHSLCLINEPGLQKLLYRSRKPTAKAIHKWVNEVVLPAL